MSAPVSVRQEIDTLRRLETLLNAAITDASKSKDYGPLLVETCRIIGYLALIERDRVINPQV